MITKITDTWKRVFSKPKYGSQIFSNRSWLESKVDDVMWKRKDIEFCGVTLGEVKENKN